MAAKKKKITRKPKTLPKERTAKKTKNSSKPKKRAAAVAPRRLASAPVAVAVQLPGPQIAISYEMIAQRAFLIWERKTYTNHSDHNWREAEAELRAELGLKGET